METETTVRVEGENFFVGDKKYPLITSGRRQAIQVHGLTQWAAKYGEEAYAVLQDQSKKEDTAGIGVFLNLLGFLTPDSLIDLFKAITGCTMEEAELYFDAAALVEAGIVVYEKHPTIRKLLDRFFSTSDSEEESQEESSTTSE